MSSSSKRQQTMAKRARELEVKERRTRKREKKQAAAAARNAELAGETELAGEMLPAPPVDREPAV
jgi:hypothetical protein